MSYKTRNIIVLSVFALLISLAGGYFVLINLPNKMEQINLKIDEVDQKISALEGIHEEIAGIKTLLVEQKEKLSNLDKQLTTSGSPAETYRYINSILDYSGVLDIDLLYLSSQSTENYNYDLYRIKGEGFFPTIYKFLWYLERGPRIYKVKKVSLHGVENREIDSTRTNLIVPFDIDFEVLYTSLEDVPPIKRNLGNVKSSRVRNPFLPYVYRNLPLNKNELLEVERGELKGILPGRAFIEDHAGKIHEMKDGDQVYLGYVSNIDVENNRVVFILNKGGIVEKFVLKLGFE